MKKKKIISLLTASAVLLSLSSAAASAESAENYDEQEVVVTMSVEEFAAFASDYGYYVTVSGNGDVSPLKHEECEYTFTNNSYQQVGLDSPILPEKAQIQNIVFSDNIASIDVKFAQNTNTVLETTKIKSGGHSGIASLTAGKQYQVWMRANSKTPLSSSNPGTVTYYWTDRGWELVE